MRFWSLQLVTGGFLCASGLLHAVAAFRRVNRRLHIAICLMALAAAGHALVSAIGAGATDPAGLIQLVRWKGSLELVSNICLTWFVYCYATQRRIWIPFALTGLWILLLGVHNVLPYTTQFRELPELRVFESFWLGHIARPFGQPSGWLAFGDAIQFLNQVYYVGSCAVLWRSDSIKAKTLSISILVFSFVIVQTVLSNRGLAPPAYFLPLAAAGVVAFLSFPLITEAAREARLSRSVEADELRWRTLLQNVQWLVISCKLDGRIDSVNPFFTNVSGYLPSEVLGRDFASLSPEKEQAETARIFQRILTGNAAEYPKVLLLRKDGELRSIVWSSVLLRDERGAATAVLSVGGDVTDFETADSARDLAIRSLEDMKARLETENQYLKEEISSTNDSHDIIGQSAGIRYVLHKIHQVAKTDATVLIEGETGVGKELVARAVHQESLRSARPFIQVNCAALAPALAESDLFGHEKGAFTGADRLRRGRFELAEGGTLFLDEVGELPPDLQSKLLRVLQEGEYERVGDSTTRKADVRIIAATNRNLKAEAAAGRFGEDLFYRLQIYPITVPPLRERRGDIPAMVEHFTKQFAQRHGKHFDEVSAPLMEALSQTDWPGNVRELANVIERAVILSKGRNLVLPNDFGPPIAFEADNGSGRIQPLAEMEREYIVRALKHTGWKIAGTGGAAELLGLNANTLRSRMDKLGIARQGRSGGNALTVKA